jgi:glycosyltransferase involved in cell wall biosynthesis
MRIAYITPYQGPSVLKRRPIVINLGLAANVKMELVAEALHTHAHEIDIISQGEVVENQFTYYPGFSEPELFHSDVPVHYASAWPVKRVNGLWSSLSTLQLFLKHHRARPYDAVIIYNLKNPQMMCAYYAMRWLKLPVILEYEDDALVDIDGKTEAGFKSSFYLRLSKAILRSVSGCIGVSPYLLSLVPRGIPSMLLRGVISDEVLALRGKDVERKKWVAFSGTFAPSKGLEPLIQAWNTLDLPDWELHIAGDGERAGVLKQLAANNKSIVFRGLLNRAENAEFLSQATIGINPHNLSKTPGNVFAFKIIEYLAAGTHVITTPMGPLEPELEAGLTYIPDNAPATIAASIQSVIAERAYLRTAADAAEQTYGPEAVGRSLDSLLRRVYSTRGTAFETRHQSSF